MTCKDCIHHKSCFNMAFRCGYKAEALDGAEVCEDFKNKADFVEVVRCKDCGVKGAAFCMAGDIPLTETTGEMFCSLGERRDT